MLRAVGIRLASLLGLVLVLSVGTFVLVHLAPQRPEAYVLGPEATPAAIESLHDDLGIDRPVPVQFVSWAGSALQGDLGTSYVSGEPVVNVIVDAAGPTLSMVAVAVVWTIVFGVLIGVLSAVWQGGPADRALSGISALGQAIPGFWLGILLVTVFALQLGWLPATGYVSPAESLSGWLRSVLLPSLALGLPAAAVVGRQLRASMVGELGKEYVRTAVAQGYNRWYVVRHHALRNALGPAITLMGFHVVVMLSTAVVVEKVFGIDGLGSSAVTAAIQQDTPVLMAAILAFGVIVLAVGVVVDLAYRWTNPRMAGA